MRKRTILFVLFFSIFTLSNAQFSEIVVMDSDDFFCAGTEPENAVHLCLIPPTPIPVPSNAYVSYTWMLRHENGNRVWHSSVAERSVYLPWEGKYQIRVKITYNRRNRSRPFAAFWSNRLRLTAYNCEDSSVIGPSND